MSHSSEDCPSNIKNVNLEPQMLNFTVPVSIFFLLNDTDLLFRGLEKP